MCVKEGAVPFLYAAGMAAIRYEKLDVCPMLAEGRSPMDAIMQRAAGLKAGVGLHLITPFEPVPLYPVLGERGFVHEARRRPDGGWEVWFHPSG